MADFLNERVAKDLNILYDSSYPKPTPAYSNHFASSIKLGTNPIAPTSYGSSAPSFNLSKSFLEISVAAFNSPLFSLILYALSDISLFF